MAEYICHHNGRFNLYSTITDTFRFGASMDENELRNLLVKECGQNVYELDEFRITSRIDRAKVKGTSSIIHTSMEQYLEFNHVGENGMQLTVDECVARFLS